MNDKDIEALVKIAHLNSLAENDDPTEKIRVVGEVEDEPEASAGKADTLTNIIMGFCIREALKDTGEDK